MGENEKLYLTHPLFPNSFDFPFEITSPETAQYNCVAWALGDSENWWEADEDYLWLDDIQHRARNMSGRIYSVKEHEMQHLMNIHLATRVIYDGS